MGSYDSGLLYCLARMEEGSCMVTVRDVANDYVGYTVKVLYFQVAVKFCGSIPTSVIPLRFLIAHNADGGLGRLPPYVLLRRTCSFSWPSFNIFRRLYRRGPPRGRPMSPGTVRHRVLLSHSFVADSRNA